MSTEETIFAQALQKPSPKERAEFLDAACSGDAALRQSVEALLEAHQRVGGVLDRTAPGLDVSTDIPAPVPDKTGSMIGPYKLLERIGEGGMGEVYMAEQQRPVRRKVAVKIIKPGMDSRQVIARFEAERQALALMEHPNIARVLDGGATDSGLPFFVMELVRGIPLTEYCDQNRLTVQQRLELFVLVCRAVQHAHQKGIIHRDLKPSNVLVTMTDGAAVPKIIDFGIAKAIGEPLTDRTCFTNYAQFLGTPLYMSPEQAGLSGQDVDTRSDIYSLGVLLYELLTGTTPFDKQRLCKAANDEIRRIIREEEPPKPSTRLNTLGQTLTTVSASRRTEPGKLSHLVRGDLDRVVMKAVEKDRSRRYETANALARDLERYIKDEPVEASPPSALYRLKKFVRRNRAGVTLGVVLAMGSGGMLGLLIYGGMRETHQKTAYIHDLQEAQRQTLTKAAQAEKSARLATIRLADSLLLAGDDKQSTGRTEQARPLYLQAGDLYRQSDVSDSNARWAMFASYVDSPPPLIGDAGLAASFGGFTWHTPKDPAHSNRVTCIALSRDGRTAVSGWRSGELNLWDLVTGAEIRRLAKQTSEIRRVAISPDGDTVLLVIRDAPLKLLDLATGEEIRSFGSPMDRVSCVAFSPDGQRALSGSLDGTLRLWDVRSGNNSRRFYGHPGAVFCIAFSPDGRSALSGGANYTVKLWDLESGKEIRNFGGQKSHNYVSSIAFSPDGRTALWGSAYRTVDLRDLSTGTVIRNFSADEGSVSFSPDGRTALGSCLSTLKIWDVQTGKEIRSFGTPLTWIHPIVFSRDTRAVVSGTHDGQTLALWCLARDAEPRSFSGHAGAAFAVAISPDGGTALSGGADATLRLWDVATGKVIRNFVGHTDAVFSVAISPDGRCALSGSSDQTVKLWDLATGETIHTFSENTDAVYSVAFSPDGRSAVSVSSDGNLKAWGLSSRKETHSIVRYEHLREKMLIDRKGQEIRYSGSGGIWDPDSPYTLSMSSVAVSPDGRTVVSGCWDKSVKLWDLATGNEIRSFSGHTDHVLSVALSPDGRTALSASADKTMKLWDLTTGKEIRSFAGHTEGVHCVAIAPDARTAISGGVDHVLKLWDLTTGNEICTLSGHNDVIASVAFTPDGQTAISASHDGTLKVWDSSRVQRYSEFAESLPKARERLARNPRDPLGLVVFGKWHAFRGMNDWAVDLLETARAGGGVVSPLTLARCYWELDRLSEARREFLLALQQSTDERERFYLQLCVHAVESEFQDRNASKASNDPQVQTRPSTNPAK